MHSHCQAMLSILLYSVYVPLGTQEPQPHLFGLIHARIYLLMAIKEVCIYN